MDGPVRIPGAPPEWLVWDEPTRCPYLPSETAHLPLRLPMRRLKPAEFARRLAEGDRRQGLLLYRPKCPRCAACEAIRLDVADFTTNATQRRVLRRGDAQLRMLIGRPTVTEEKVALYNRHKMERGLTTGDGLIDAEGYEQFLAESCTDTIEIRYVLHGLLVGVAIADRAADALSAVYCFYDPSFARLEPRHLFGAEADRPVPAVGPALSLPGPVRRREPGHGLQGALSPARAPHRRRVATFLEGIGTPRTPTTTKAHKGEPNLSHLRVLSWSFVFVVEQANA